MRFANTNGYSPSDAPSILGKCRKMVGENITVGDARVSTSAIEVDIFIPKNKEETEVAKSIAKALGPVLDIRHIDDSKTEMTKEEFLRRGVELFNQERFWECHELLEAAWKNEKGQERDLIQSIILAAAAFVHFQKNEDRVGLGVIGRALSKMQWKVSSYHGVDIKGLRDNLDAILRRGKIAIFKIRLNES